MNKKILESVALVAMVAMLFSVSSCNCKMQKDKQSVSVSGIGTVLTQPDMVQMSIGFSHTAATTKEAKNAVNKTMQQIISILKAENIEDKFVKTTWLNYDEEYEYRNGRRVRLGQRAQQTILVTVNDIVNTPERFSSILDKITAIDKVELQNINFDIENKTELYKKSRELAYQKAFEKAQQYAELSNSRIDGVLSISELGSRDVAQTRAYQNNYAAKEEALSDYGSSPTVPTGEKGISSEVNVVFLLK